MAETDQDREEDESSQNSVKDTWVENDRNVLSPVYDLQHKNRGLRLQLVSDGYLTIIQAIIRPPRCIYNIHEDLGPEHYYIRRQRTKLMIRKDSSIQCPKRGNIKISHWDPQQGSENMGHVCVVYVHGNAGSRMDVVNNGILDIVGQRGLSLVAFDCSGDVNFRSGLSDGDYCTLGHFEKEDLALVVEDIVAKRGEKVRIILWGFSMGAATCMLYTSKVEQKRNATGKTHNISSMILDSSFSSFRELVLNHPLALERRGCGALLRVLYPFVRRSVRRRSGMNVDDLDVLSSFQYFSESLPAAFIGCCNDMVVPHSHGVVLHEKFPGIHKRFWSLEGKNHDHNSRRPIETLVEVTDFIVPLSLNSPSS